MVNSTDVILPIDSGRLYEGYSGVRSSHPRPVRGYLGPLEPCERGPRVTVTLTTEKMIVSIVSDG